jgi:Zn-dependent protease
MGMWPGNAATPPPRCWALDPRRHLDPLGTLCLVFLGFGWAKPVPVNPRNFQNYRRDDFLVSIAGITVNLTLFLLSLALAVGFNGLLWKPEVISFYGAKELYGLIPFVRLPALALGVNAVLLGGAGADNIDAMRYPWVQYIQRFLLMFSTMNLCVGIFNLLPIPPLDGFHILNDIVLKGRLTLNQNMFQITQVVLIALCLTGALTGILSSVTGAVEDAVLNLMLAIAGLG